MQTPLISRKLLILPFVIIQSFCGLAQSTPNSLAQANYSAKIDSTVFEGSNGELVIYKKPKPFSFITQVPKTITVSIKMTVSKKLTLLLQL